MSLSLIFSLTTLASSCIERAPAILDTFVWKGNSLWIFYSFESALLSNTVLPNTEASGRTGCMDSAQQLSSGDNGFSAQSVPSSQRLIKTKHLYGLEHASLKQSKRKRGKRSLFSLVMATRYKNVKVGHSDAKEKP